MRNTAKTIGSSGIEGFAPSAGHATDSYLELIRELPLRRIKTAAEHSAGKNLLLRLSVGRADRGTRDYIDVLVDLIADFERRGGHQLERPELSAAELVRHRLGERGMTVSAAAKEIGVPQSNLSAMLNGKREWSKSVMKGLGGMLGIRAERFLQRVKGG